MSWRELGQTFADGDVIAPSDLNDTFIPFLSEINGRIDRDNIAYQVLTSAKIATKQAHRVWNAKSDTPLALDTTAEGSALPPTPVLSADILAEEWITIRASVSYENVSSPYTLVRVFVGLQVDDVVVAMQEPEMLGFNIKGTRSLVWAGPVPSGAATVVLFLGAAGAKPFAGLYPTGGVHLSVTSRAITVLEGRR